jgi:glycosyltransferase involved in cell wall biosynthesis
MLEGHTILCLAYSRWSDQITDWELMRRFATSNNVVFVEIQEKYENLRGQGLRRRRCVKSFVPQPPRWIDDNLVVIKAPTMLPLSVSLLSRLFPEFIGRLSTVLSKRIFVRYIKYYLFKLSLHPSILWFHLPQDILLANKFGERLVCYRTFDEVSLFPSNEPFRMLLDTLERENIGEVDLIFASSRAQFEKRKPLNKNTHLLPNAVDFELFSRAMANECTKPVDMQGLTSPLIGFMGTIDFRFDFDLVRTIAVSRPQWSVVLIGPAHSSLLDRLNELSNVYWLGPKPRDELARYLKFFDVATIPYLVTSSTNTMYPWKLHEYFAAGLPVVSTNLNEMQPFSDIVRIAQSSQEFIAAVEEELKTNSPGKAGERLKVARQNSWDKRIEEMSVYLEKALERKLMSSGTS